MIFKILFKNNISFSVAFFTSGQSLDTLDQAMIETLTVKMKEVILEIIEGSKININQVRKANTVPAEPPSEVWVFAQIFDFFLREASRKFDF